MPPPSRLKRLRQPDQSLSSRTQDATAEVLNPVAEAVGATPIMGAPPPAWIKPDLLNGFSQAGAPNPVTAYHKDALGYVHAKVAIIHNTGTGATDVFKFNAGCRPSETLLVQGSNGGGALFEFTVGATGAFRNLTVFGAFAAAQVNFSFLAER